jgi:mRNA interferase RelE/StbE
MARYAIEFSPGARRQFRKLPEDAKRRVAKAVDALAAAPRPFGAEKLSGEENTYRIPAGDYRVLYDVSDRVLLVLVIRIGHRGDVYRRRATR